VVQFSRRGLLGAALVAVAGCTTTVRRNSTAAPTGTATSPSSAASTGPSTVAPSGAPTASAPGPGGFVAFGPRTRAAVALTFHASGSPALAERLLALVEAAGVPITVFAVGSWLEANPGQAARILRGGHELANHTYTHPTLGSLPAPAVLTEITRCRDVLARLAGSPGRWFRPSAMNDPTPLVTAQATAAGYATIVGYDVDSRDFTDPGAATVTRLTMAGVQNGSIVSMHFDHQDTIAALPGILDGLRSKGLTPVTVSRLLRA